jgi:hypothetical protein
MSGQDARKELGLLINSQFPIICLETWEEVGNGQGGNRRLDEFNDSFHRHT